MENRWEQNRITLRDTEWGATKPIDKNKIEYFSLSDFAISDKLPLYRHLAAVSKVFILIHSHLRTKSWNVRSMKFLRNKYAPGFMIVQHIQYYTLWIISSESSTLNSFRVCSFLIPVFFITHLILNMSVWLFLWTDMVHFDVFHIFLLEAYSCLYHTNVHHLHNTFVVFFGLSLIVQY